MISKSKASEVLRVLIIKFSSIAIMGGIFLFLWFYGGFGGIGDFAAITAIIAPLGVFSQFRYIEYITLAKNKKEGLYFSLYSSLIVFLILSLVFILMQVCFFEFSILYLLAIIYKVFEMFFEFQNAYFVNIEKISNAIWINLFRILGVILLFVFYPILFSDVDYLLFCFLFLITSNMVLSFFSGLEFRKIKLSAIMSYVNSNYSYGFTSMFMSLNSLVPRYFYMFIGDSKGLGIFTVLYLFASTSVNIFQYLFSVKAKYLEKLYSAHLRNIKKVALVFVFPLIFLFQDFNFYVVVILSFLLMFVFMLIRGAVITVNVVWGKKSLINISMIGGMVLSVVLILGLFFYNNKEFYINNAALYVCLSSLITSYFLLCSSKRKYI